jgi:hypothetical protein
MKKTMSLDDFLRENTNENFLCTIEVISKDSEKVKLTPWFDQHEGCNCDAAIIIDKQLIESVSPTDNTHVCCGKKHKVVEVFFKDGASIKIEDIVKEAIEKAGKKKKEHSANLFSKTMPYQNTTRFMQPTGMMASYGSFNNPIRYSLSDGCDVQQAPSGVCESGCQCRGIYSNWYCCQAACCL